MRLSARPRARRPSCTGLMSLWGSRFMATVAKSGSNAPGSFWSAAQEAPVPRASPVPTGLPLASPRAGRPGRLQRGCVCPIRPVEPRPGTGMLALEVYSECTYRSCHGMLSRKVDNFLFLRVGLKRNERLDCHIGNNEVRTPHIYPENHFETTVLTVAARQTL